MRLTRFLSPAVLLATAGLAVGQTALTTVRVASGLSRPVFVTAPPGDTDRIFVVEQRGLPMANQARVQVYRITASGPYTLLGTFITISNVSTGNEQGLLGMAFDPGYLTNGRFYLHWSDAATGGGTRIERFVDSNSADNVYTPGSQNTVLTVAQPFTNHNGGWIAFGPDGMLYIALGDGGSANDPSNRAQNLNEFLGKMHRIDVSGAVGYTSPPSNPFVGVAGLDEIWHYGLRNSWRNSFDRATGALYIGDVGQNAVEEIDYTAPGVGGLNYLWRCMEGASCVNTGCTCITCNTVSGQSLLSTACPIFQYSHVGGACSLTGGYVYRGARIPDLQGTYFFADYCTAQISSFVFNGSTIPTATNRTAELAPGGGLSIATITSFGEDASGEMYICDQGGEVFKIIVNCAVGTPMSINDQPDPVSICPGQPLNLSVGIINPRGGVTFQWVKDGMDILGATNSTYSVPAATGSDAGNYKVRVADQCNPLESIEVAVSVAYPVGDVQGDCDVDSVDVQLFIDVLLGLDFDPGRVARSNINGIGGADGDDVPGMVDAVIP